MIPLSVPNFEGNEEKYVCDAVSQGWVSTGGAYVEQLEKVIAKVLVNNCVGMGLSPFYETQNVVLYDYQAKNEAIVIWKTK